MTALDWIPVRCRIESFQVCSQKKLDLELTHDDCFASEMEQWFNTEEKLLKQQVGQHEKESLNSGLF